MAEGQAERRERKDAQRNLERVLRAAHELFAERGQDVKMEEVAQRAGVGVGTIYRRFRSKEELFAAVSEAVCASTCDMLQRAAGTDRDPAGKLRALVLVQYRRSSQEAALIDMRPSTDVGCGASEQQQVYDTLHSLLTQVIAEGQCECDIRAGEPAVLAALCLELLSPRAFQRLARVSGACPEEIAALTADFVLHALRAGEPRASN